jgi:hypothetical protein
MEKIIKVKPLQNYLLELTFSNSEVRFFDVKPYLEFGFFKELKEENYFKQVKINFDSIAWQNGQDFSPATLYIKSIPIEQEIA